MVFKSAFIQVVCKGNPNKRQLKTKSGLFFTAKAHYLSHTPAPPSATRSGTHNKTTVFTESHEIRM